MRAIICDQDAHAVQPKPRASGRLPFIAFVQGNQHIPRGDTNRQRPGPGLFRHDRIDMQPMLVKERGQVAHASLEFVIFVWTSWVVHIHGSPGAGLNPQGTGRHLQRLADIRPDFEQLEKPPFV